MIVIDPDADRPVYKQLADLVREQIESGELPPDARIPAEVVYVQEHGISRDSVRKAMAQLRHEGLIITTARGSRVRPAPAREEITVDEGLAYARMPTEPERRQLRLQPGVPVLVIERPGQEPEILPADRAAVRIRREGHG
ncbi:winged helix-turn-helix domain-containing protein [Microbispora bryophytorum]|uniref:winged helix-turn-helix domain-containing protein n=1 Tax=Microbispora bryophytorum TaxID=1460882 RepID=UPI0033E987D2